MDSITRENTPTRNNRKWKLERHIIEASMTFTLNFATNLSWWKFLRKLANHNQCGISWIESPHQVNGLCISWFFQFFCQFLPLFWWSQSQLVQASTTNAASPFLCQAQHIGISFLSSHIYKGISYFALSRNHNRNIPGFLFCWGGWPWTSLQNAALV